MAFIIFTNGNVNGDNNGYYYLYDDFDTSINCNDYCEFNDQDQTDTIIGTTFNYDR